MISEAIESLTTIEKYAQGKRRCIGINSLKKYIVKLEGLKEKIKSWPDTEKKSSAS